MQENNQSRTMMYAVLIGLGVVILGLGIWLVMRSDSTSSDADSTTNTSKTSSSSSTSKATVPSGYKAYSNDVLAYSFGYPESWKIEPFGGSNTSSSLITFKSPDYTEQANPGGGSTISKGAALNVNVIVGAAPVEDTKTSPISSKAATISGVTGQQKVYKAASYYTTVTTFQGTDKFASSDKELKKGARYFTVTLTTVEAPEASASSDVLQQALSSFKIN